MKFIPIKENKPQNSGVYLDVFNQNLWSVIPKDGILWAYSHDVNFWNHVDRLPEGLWSKATYDKN